MLATTAAAEESSGDSARRDIAELADRLHRLSAFAEGRVPSKDSGAREGETTAQALARAQRLAERLADRIHSIALGECGALHRAAVVASASVLSDTCLARLLLQLTRGPKLCVR